MSTREQQLDIESLEAMVDRHGLAPVVELLAEICFAKAEHTAVTWQDTTTAKVWERDGSTLQNAATKLIGDRK